ncbi:unnamed protein product [Cuscuta epithymum]|nr:unnamed protein product [Cuscuta epithymum]
MDDHNKGQDSSWLVIEDGETAVSRRSGPTRSFSQPLDHNQSVKIKRNHKSSTRVLGNESRRGKVLVRTLSDQTSKYPLDDDRATTTDSSSISTPKTLWSGERGGHSHNVWRPSYMNTTESVKALRQLYEYD